MFWNVPNILTLSRLPLSALLFAAIAEQAWFVGFCLFLIASITDWLDGWWARRYNQMTDFGRMFDPLIDKVMIGGAYIYLVLVPEAGLLPWMVTVVISREMLITGIRGYIEAQGRKFGADWFGKLKMVLQCVLLGVILMVMTLRQQSWAAESLPWLEMVQWVTLVAMLTATIGSGLQYCWRAIRILNPSR